MLKRAFDIVVSALTLLTLSPLWGTIAVLVWRQDGRSPFYTPRRVARGGGDFIMVKMRSMVVGADRTGVSSTANDDRRITPLGRFIRRYKIDELMQLWNVLKGDMSFVGPRPNMREWGVNLYTEEEKRLLTVRPGITDLSSIVFSDEGDILTGSANPDLDYNRLIRPWKSRLGLLYIDRQSLWLDLEIIGWTALAIVSRPKALAGVQRILERLNATAELRHVCLRTAPLQPSPPPGEAQPVMSALWVAI